MHLCAAENQAEGKTVAYTYMYVTWSIEIKRMSQKFEGLRQTEAGDFSLKFFRYRSTSSQRGLRALAGC